MLGLEDDGDSNWSIKFDPYEFCQENKDLKTEDFKLDEEQLRQSAI